MKKRILCFSLVLFSLGGFSQSFERLSNETTASFVKRICQVNDLAHPVIETKEWDSTKK